MTRSRFIALFSLLSLFALAGACRRERTVIPKAPDYADATMWYTADGDADGTGADVFYVVSTWEEDWKDEKGRVAHYADVWNPVHREHMGIEITPAVLHDSITVTLAPEYHTLVVTGYDGAEYQPYKDFINVGDIHSCEPWLYSDCIRENIAVRTESWREQQQAR